MNIRILDAMINYERANIVFPKNFYVRLAYYLVSKLGTKKNVKSWADALPTSRDILGNSVEVKVNSDGSGITTINGLRIKGSGTTMKYVESVIMNAFAAETKKELTINRPDGRTAKKDRLEFKNIEGTIFPTLNKTAANAAGYRDFSLKGSINKESVVLKVQAEGAPNFNKDLFKEYNNDYISLFVKKDVIIKDYTSTSVGLETFMNIVFNPTVSGAVLDLVSRDERFEFFVDEHPHTSVLFIYEGTSFLTEWRSYGWKLIKWITNPNKIKID